MEPTVVVSAAAAAAAAAVEAFVAAVVVDIEPMEPVGVQTAVALDYRNGYLMCTTPDGVVFVSVSYQILSVPAVVVVGVRAQTLSESTLGVMPLQLQEVSFRVSHDDSVIRQIRDATVW